jgi:hypothetical protein
MNHLTEDQLVLHYYGEEMPGAQEHLHHCESCRQVYQVLQRVLNSVDSLPVPERGADYEARVWQAIADRLPREHAGYQRAWRWFAWKPLAVAAAMAALIVGAFLVGRRMEKAPQTAAVDTQVRERVLLVAIGDHLERSQMILVELENAGAPKNGHLDITYEQNAAEDLLQANRLYRQTAANSGDTATTALLEDLERVLLEIAHSPSAVSEKQLDELRRQIEDPGILFKVKVFGSQVEHRVETDSRNKS